MSNPNKAHEVRVRLLGKLSSWLDRLTAVLLKSSMLAAAQYRASSMVDTFSFRHPNSKCESVAHITMTTTTTRRKWMSSGAATTIVLVMVWTRDWNDRTTRSLTMGKVCDRVMRIRDRREVRGPHGTNRD